MNQLQRINNEASGPFDGKLDMSRVALAGHSLGGLTTLLGVRADSRFRAGIRARDRRVVLITTYERDSIWKVERGVTLATGDVSVAERIVRLRGHRYRYQEISPVEVLQPKLPV